MQVQSDADVDPTDAVSALAGQALQPSVLYALVALSKTGPIPK
jgi:hypothetical protein